MIGYLYNAFNRLVARATQPTEAVNAENNAETARATQQQLELYA